MTDYSLTLGRTSQLFNKKGKTRKGKYGLKELVKDGSIKWTTDLNFSAGELDFDLVEKAHPIIPYTGDKVSFIWNKHKVFYGRVFKYSVNEDNTISVKCYDNSRYLKNQDSIVFKAGTAADRFNQVCKQAGLKHKVVKTPSHKLRAEICEGKSYFDMIKSAIDKTTTATGHRYFVLANYNVIELRRVPYKKLKIYVGSKSGMTGFTYSVDIDNTYNVIRVTQKDHKKSQGTTATAKGKVYEGSTEKPGLKQIGTITKSVGNTGKAKTTKKKSTKETPENTSFKSETAKGKSVAQWGPLQEVVNAKDKANQAQMLKQAQGELKLKNRANKTLTVECIGNIDLVAGNAVTIKINDLGKEIKNCPIIKAVHTFGTDYKCELTMKAGKSWQESGS